MKKVLATLAALSLPLAAFAQEPQPQPAPAAEAPAAEPPPPTTEERLTTLQGRLDALEEQYKGTQAEFDLLKRIKLSGYIQARYVYSDASTQTSVIDGFTVRRGRLKATVAATDWASFMLQIDAVPAGVTLKDAEATLYEPWTGKKLSLTLGQTKWPFGYEGPQSSGDREFPERTRVVRAFLPGERDRGAKLNGKVAFLRFNLGVFDGNGTDNAPFLGKDNDKNKDVIGRVGVDLGWVCAGVSGWWGRTFRPGDATVEAGTFDRNRIGADVQLYLDVLPFGATALKAEYIAGNTYMRSRVEQFGVPASGWYALLVQSFGLSNQVAVRYDYFDAEAGAPNAADPKDASRPAANNPVGTIGLLVSHQWDELLKISAVYEIPITGGVDGTTDPADNQFTLQFQAKF